MFPNIPLSSTSSSPDSARQHSPHPPIQKGYSCILCAQRKVKCDKAPGGCNNCSRARVSCIYKPPPPPRRRRKGTRELDVHTRLRIYEDALRTLGVDPSELEKQELAKFQSGNAASTRLDTSPRGLPKPEKMPPEAGMLVSDKGKSRYLEGGLWSTLKAEFRDPKDMLDESSDEETYDSNGPRQRPPGPVWGWNMLLSGSKVTTQLGHLHPQPLQIFKLWQTFLDNVYPLIKVFHAPTIQQLILDASADLDHVPKNLEALMFAIYSVTLLSIDEADCRAIMGDSNSAVTQRFQSGAQCALINANFLKTNDIMVLQALVLFLVSTQNRDDARVVWLLSGIAHRIGQRIGLHRDGEALNLPPFETEVRRRLWWQILFLEGFSEKLAGVGNNIFMGDTKPPLNVNDSDLFPGMKEFPKEHEGATEMMFFLIRCCVGVFLKRNHPTPVLFDGFWNKSNTSIIPITTKHLAIEDLEAMFHRKYLSGFNSAIPWHYMCNHVSKAIIAVMRLIGHAAQYREIDPAKIPPAEKDLLFDLSLDIISIHNHAYTKKEMKGFIWHINAHFQWKAFICLVGLLCYHTTAPKTDIAWEQVKLVYDFHPDFAKEETRQALPIAIGTLTLKAWEAYIAARGVPETGEPYYIQLLRTQRMETSKTRQKEKSQPKTQDVDVLEKGPADQGVGVDAWAASAGPSDGVQWDPSFMAQLDQIQVPEFSWDNPQHMEWAEWDNLLVDFQG